MIYAFAAVVLASLALITTFLVLYVRARDQLRKVEVGDVSKFKEEIARLERANGTFSQVIKDNEDTLLRERAARDVMKGQLASYRELLLSCEDPDLIRDEFNRMFSGDVA